MYHAICLFTPQLFAGWYGMVADPLCMRLVDLHVPTSRRSLAKRTAASDLCHYATGAGLMRRTTREFF